jgi:membrane carboxypeptidase/penicillin-binding protein PbpC
MRNKLFSALLLGGLLTTAALQAQSLPPEEEFKAFFLETTQSKFKTLSLEVRDYRLSDGTTPYIDVIVWVGNADGEANGELIGKAVINAIIQWLEENGFDPVKNYSSVDCAVKSKITNASGRSIVKIHGYGRWNFFSEKAGYKKHVREEL